MVLKEIERSLQKELIFETPIIKVRGLTKEFPGVTALDGVDFDLFSREIHVVLGQNGAGKTTLMNIFYGLYRPDEGEILIKGQLIDHYSPQEAIQKGIGMVHQDFKLVGKLTVAENIILGDKTQPLWLSKSKINAQVRVLSEQYGLVIDPAVKVADLPVGLQQRVAILKALSRGAEILILDEPTSVLTPQETEILFDNLMTMKQQEKTIVLITHKLAEALAVADRITVLREGKIVGTVKPGEVDQKQLAIMMIGAEVKFDIQKPETEPGEFVLKLEDVHTKDEDKRGLRGVSFQLREREILGIAGVAGNGQTALAEVITGLREIIRGAIYINGQRLSKLDPLRAINLGLTHIPEDRRGMGVAMKLPVGDNLILRRYRQPPFTLRGLLRREAIVNFGRELIQRFRIVTPGLETPAGELSGGNLQRVIVGREIDASQGILIANLPTQGLDVEATASVRRLLIEQQQDGQAILLISHEIDEILTLSDQIGVMSEGRMFGPFPRNKVHREEIGLMMAGIDPKVKPNGSSS